MGWLIASLQENSSIESSELRSTKICGYRREPFLQEQAPLNVGLRRVCFGSDGIGQHQY